MSTAKSRTVHHAPHAYARRRVDRWVKRAIDVAGACGGLAVLSPVLIAATTAIFVSMSRPVFFTQIRPGYRGHPFRVYKFRTMTSAKAHEVWFRTDDQRLTPLGRFLRQWSVDELPALWNVLRGDMSLVGPRPLLPEYLSKYTPTEMRRHEMPPGISWLGAGQRPTAHLVQRATRARCVVRRPLDPGTRPEDPLQDSWGCCLWPWRCLGPERRPCRRFGPVKRSGPARRTARLNDRTRFSPAQLTHSALNVPPEHASNAKRARWGRMTSFEGGLCFFTWID